MCFRTMSAFSSVNGILRLCETFTAATNWPKLRNPFAASTGSAPPNRDCSLLASCVCDWTFNCTGVSVVVLVVDAVFVVEVVVVACFGEEACDELPCVSAGAVG